jgi:hypothetical protein
LPGRGILLCFESGNALLQVVNPIEQHAFPIGSVLLLPETAAYENAQKKRHADY